MKEVARDIVRYETREIGLKFVEDNFEKTLAQIEELIKSGSYKVSVAEPQILSYLHQAEIEESEYVEKLNSYILAIAKTMVTDKKEL